MADRLCMHNGFPIKMIEQTIMMSRGDVKRISHVHKWEGYIKERCNRTGGVWLQWYCHLVIQKHTLGSSTKPQTLYLDYLCASHVGSINWNYSVTYFVNKCASQPIWRTFSYYHFICLMLAKVDHYLLP